MNKILKSLLSVRYSTLRDLILKYNHHNQNWFIHLMNEYWAHTLLRQHAEGLGEKSHQDRSVMASKQYFSLNKGCLFWLARYTSKITNDYSYIFFIVIIITHLISLSSFSLFLSTPVNMVSSDPYDIPVVDRIHPLLQRRAKW